MFEIQQHFSENVKFHLKHKGEAMAAKERAVSTEDKTPIAGKRWL